MAAPPMKPTIAACDKKSIKKPNLIQTMKLFKSAKWKKLKGFDKTEL